MIGDYLTTKGRQVEDDLRMIDSLQLQIRGDTQQRREARKAKASSATHVLQPLAK